MAFLHLPVELRLEVYSHLFGAGIAFIDGGRQDTGDEAKHPSMIPATILLLCHYERSSQILRTCKTILAEARPMLYKNTTFRVSFRAFAGRLPIRMTGSHRNYPHIKHLEWSLSCDILKRYNSMDVLFHETDVGHLQSLQLVCQAENWKGSFCGEWCDREIFVQGRQQMTDFAQLLLLKMSNDTTSVTLVEDVRQLSRGRVVLRLFRKDRAKAAGVCLFFGLKVQS